MLKENSYHIELGDLIKMWLPKDQKELLLFYYKQLGDQCVKGLDLNKSVLISTIKLLNPKSTEKVEEDIELEIMDSPIYEKVKNAQGHLEANNFIQLKNSNTGRRRIRTHPEDKIIYKMKEVYLTTEGCDLARRYSDIFKLIGLWWKEYGPHPIWSVVGIIFVAIISPLIVNGIGQYISTKEQGTKQEIRTLFEAVSPKILKEIDSGDKDILVAINVPKEVELLNISKRPDFSKYLSLKQEHDRYDAIGCISDPNDVGKKSVYHIYPKDALVK